MGGQPVVGYNICGTTAGGGCLPNLHVAVSDGEAWSDLGLVVPGLAPNYCALFLDSKNNPTVAWGNSPSNGVAQVVFSTWIGTAWVTSTYPAIDLTAAQGAAADAISVVLDGSGHPFVAYRGDVYHPSTSTNIYVAAWTGTTWDTSYGSIGDPKSSTFDLVLNASNQPIVTVVVLIPAVPTLWNGTSWSFGGGSSSANATATVDSSGNPVMLTSASSSHG